MSLLELLLYHLELLKLVKILSRVEIYILLVTEFIEVHVMFIALELVPMTLFMLVMLVHVFEN